jgi:hypothetical protein
MTAKIPGEGMLPTAQDWTPVLQFGGAAVGLTYSARTGATKRVGNVVYFEMRITLSAKGSSTGAVTITGIPIAADTAAGALSVGYYSGMASITTLAARIAGSTIRLANTGAAATTDLTHANFTDTTDIVISGVYHTAA